eukprot:s901_g18.t1
MLRQVVPGSLPAFVGSFFKTTLLTGIQHLFRAQNELVPGPLLAVRACVPCVLVSFFQRRKLSAGSMQGDVQFWHGFK